MFRTGVQAISLDGPETAVRPICELYHRGSQSQGGHSDRASRGLHLGVEVQGPHAHPGEPELRDDTETTSTSLQGRLLQEIGVWAAGDPRDNLVTPAAGRLTKTEARQLRDEVKSVWSNPRISSDPLS